MVNRVINRVQASELIVSWMKKLHTASRTRRQSLVVKWVGRMRRIKTCREAIKIPAIGWNAKAREKFRDKTPS